MTAREQIARGERFGFGDNWRDFSRIVDEDRIRDAQCSLTDYLATDSLEGTRFLDIGCGSGLFSLAARRLGASVRSFDFDESAVEVTRALKEQHFPDDVSWSIEHGSVLDRTYIEKLGAFDVCYAWGVLHHTGDLWRALFNAQLAVKPGGLLYVAIYNDQGVASALWEVVKRTYCSGPLGRAAMTGIFYPAFFYAGLAVDLASFRSPARRYREHREKHRGMSLVHDWKDWLGGYPYEPARPERVRAFLDNLGFDCRRFEPPAIGFGNNQFVFEKR